MPAISGNGRVVVFACFDSDLVQHDQNQRWDYFARDLSAGTTYLVTAKVLRPLSILDELSLIDSPAISANGRFVMFTIPKSVGNHTYTKLQ